MANRGVSPVVGMVFLVGLTTIVALSVIVVGLTVLDGAQSAAERNQAENSMVELADTADDVASSEVRSSEFQFQGDEKGSTWVDESAGNVTVALVNGSNTSTLTSTDLGVYRHETTDGTEIAYQGGGVWRHDSGVPQMVEPPNFDYRAGDINGSSAPTLTFPYVRIGGPSTDSGNVDGKLSVTNETSFTDDRSSRIKGDYLYVDIESQYCKGWEEHLDDRTDGKVTQQCGDDDTLRVNLTVPESYTNETLHVEPGDDEYETFVNNTHGLFAENDFRFDNAGGTINGTIGAGENISFSEGTGYDQRGERIENASHEREPYDDTIDELTDNATWDSLCTSENSRCEYDAGTYYIDDFNDGAQSVTFDVEDGNVTLVLRDDLRTDDRTEWAVENHETGGTVKVFVPGDMRFEGSTAMGAAGRAGEPPGPEGINGQMSDPVANQPDTANAEALQFLGSSDTEIHMTGAFHVEAKISAPSNGTGNQSEAFAVGSSSFKFIGALHAGTIDMSNSATDIYQDPDVATEETEVRINGSDDTTYTTVNQTNPEADIYYVHVSETVMEIED